jgi:branched-chain amino acid aminotransferase
MLDVRGFVAETNATNVFIVHRGEILTSQPIACPEGITRATIMEICAAQQIACREQDISVSEVYRADEVFCTGTMGEIAPVIKVDGRTIAAGQPGPLTQRLSELFVKRTANEGVMVI